MRRGRVSPAATEVAADCIAAAPGFDFSGASGDDAQKGRNSPSAAHAEAPARQAVLVLARARGRHLRQDD
jgi:hypothetical protein